MIEKAQPCLLIKAKQTIVWQDGKYILIYVSIHTQRETHAIVIAKPYLDLME